jgi:phospholipid/cholesterol/gamma-HCH transport system permease protein
MYIYTLSRCYIRVNIVEKEFWYSMQIEEIQLPGTIDRQWVESEGLSLLSRHSSLILDFTETNSIDSAGVALVQKLNLERPVEIVAIPQNILSLIEVERASVSEESIHKERLSFEQIGTAVYEKWGAFLEALSILVEMLYWGTFGVLKKRDFRKGILGEQMYHLGYGAIGITVSLTFLIGIALAVQSAIQLKAFGADVFLIAMVVQGMIRELGPLMAAIILAGRTGSATTAEIATMKVQEEVDALRTMGLNEIQFIVVPKFWALSLTMPLVTVLATMAGILGGALVAWSYVGMSADMIRDEFVKNIVVKDFSLSIIKSLVFSWLIIWIGAYYGFQVSGGAEEVGRETTRSVVAAIFVIVVADAIFSFFY